MRRSTLPIVAAALLAACDQTATQPREQSDDPSFATVFNERYTIPNSATFDCTGDVVPFESLIHEKLSITEDAAGGFHVAFHVNLSGAATNPASGATYQFRSILNSEYYVRGEGVEQTFLLTGIGIGQGGALNEVTTIRFHMTVTPEGTVTSFFDELHVQCQGG
jgi:hypothetical protein